MRVKIADVGEGAKRMEVEVAWDDVRGDYDDMVEEYAKLPVPGFRPGKAPRPRVESHYRTAIVEDLQSRCIDRFTRQALKDQQVMAGSRLEVSGIVVVPEEPFRFAVEFTPLPEFELPDYSNVNLQSDSDPEKRDEISQWLLEHTVLTVPNELVREELRFDGADDSDPGSDKWQRAAERVKLMVTLQKIAEVDGIEVDDRDVDDRLEYMAEEYRMSSGDLRQRLLQNGGLLRVRNFLSAEMTLDYLLDVNAADRE
jgi:FKBP-type peptidyl-prolyl cis-trans isomerase (trigger factor)